MNPISWYGNRCWILFFGGGYWAGVAAFQILYRNAIEGSEAMVILVEQFGLIQREESFLVVVADKYVALELVSCFFKLFAGAEESRIACHVKHLHEANAPGIFFLLRIACFFQQYTSALIHLAGNFHIAPSAENGTGLRIGIEQQEVVHGEGETSFCFLQVFSLVQKECKFCFGCWVVLAG